MSGDDLHDEMLSCDTYVLISDSNVADPWRNGHIWKVFELAEPRFRRDMECDFRI